MTMLAHKLGLSPELQFYDIYSLDEPQLLAHIPRPALALLVIIPLTESWASDRRAEDAAKSDYDGFGSDEPVIWFKQTIGNACGSIGLLHAAVNGPAAEHIVPGSDLDKIRAEAIPLRRPDRAAMLYDSLPFERAHKHVELLGDTAPPAYGGHAGQHFVTFVIARGRLWELEGSRKGPLDRGAVPPGDDVLSPGALDLGLKRVIRLRHGGDGSGTDDLRFSCLALARST